MLVCMPGLIQGLSLAAGWVIMTERTISCALTQHYWLPLQMQTPDDEADAQQMNGPDQPADRHSPSAPSSHLAWKPLPGLVFVLAQITSHLGAVWFAVAAPAGRTVLSGLLLYDALQLVLFGAHAITNFEWTNCTTAHIAEAVEELERQGFSGRQAMLAGWDAVGTSRAGVPGVTARKTADGGAVLSVQVPWLSRDGRRCTLCFATDAAVHGSQQRRARGWSVAQEASAARMADRVALVLRGLACTTNFPASECAEEQLWVVAASAIRQGVDARLVDRNVQDVRQVCLTLRRN
jgi:hypothetical protein